MITRIHTSKKLEKIIKKIMETESPGAQQDGILGKWNASFFNFSRKKCWLITNEKTRYSIILMDIKASDLSRIEAIFKDNFFSQLIYDGIFIEFSEVDQMIGTLKFHPTDNDRSTIGLQNEFFATIDYRKQEYGSIENFPLRKINHQLNTYPFYEKKKGPSILSSGLEELKIVLNN